MKDEDIMRFLAGGEYADIRGFAHDFAESVEAFQNEGFSRDEAIWINLELIKSVIELGGEE